MIELARFDARDDAVPMDRGGWSGGGRSWWEVDPEAEGVGRLLCVVGAYVQQWWLNRILRAYPNSLYCPHCRYLLKRP